MESRFSARYGYSKAIQPYIVDDAPEVLRNAYVDLVVKKFVYIDKDTRYPQGKAVLGAKSIYETLTAELLIARHPDYNDSWFCLDILFALIRQEVDWNEFYDIVESIGVLVQDIQEELDSFYNEDHWNEAHCTYDDYRDDVNQIFTRAKVVWRLDDNSKLSKDIPKELEQSINQTKETLIDEYGPSLNHMEKALKYSRDRKNLDPENAIKEIVSAIEALTNAIWPKAKTLGNAVQEMRKAGWPKHIAAMIEKLYAFASDEPAVRHGKHQESKIQLADAEFCVHTGIALLRYIHTYSLNQPHSDQI